MAQLDKPIIHFQIPIDDKGEPKVEYYLLNFFMEWAKKTMGDKAYILTSVCDIDVIGAEVEKVKVDEISLADFLKKYDFKDGKKE